MRNFPLIKFLFIFSVAISLGIYFELNQKIFIYLFFFSFVVLAFYELTVSNSKKLKKVLSELLIVLVIFFSGLTSVIIQTDKLKDNFVGNYIELFADNYWIYWINPGFTKWRTFHFYFRDDVDLYIHSIHISFFKV